MNDRIVVSGAKGDTNIELSTLDPRTSGAETLLADLYDAIEHNRRTEPVGVREIYEALLASHALEEGGGSSETLTVEELASKAQPLTENWPLRYKRGLLSVAVGRCEPMPMWVQVGGLVITCYDKPDVRSTPHNPSVPKTYDIFTVLAYSH
jgi:hypothetical protein